MSFERRRRLSPADQRGATTERPSPTEILAQSKTIEERITHASEANREKAWNELVVLTNSIKEAIRYRALQEALGNEYKNYDAVALRDLLNHLSSFAQRLFGKTLDS